MNTFMDALTKNEKSYTANDGTVYRTSGSKLVDLNFSVPALRQAAVNFYGKDEHSRYFYGEDWTMDAVDALRLFIYILRGRAYLYHEMALCMPPY